MKLTFTVDTDEIQEDVCFEDLFSDAMRKEIMDNVKKNMLSETFKNFSKLVSDTIVSDTKLKMQNFLDEEIALTARYGEKTFVGTVEDLIKLRFDEVILKPVDSSGNLINGCTSKSYTWIEWAIEKQLTDVKTKIVKDAASLIEKKVKEEVANQLIAIKEKAIKDQVRGAFASILQQGE